MVSVQPVPAFNDNYIWLIRVAGHDKCCVVDPGEAAPVLKVLEQQGLALEAILLTHHHTDHVGGETTLRQRFPECAVYGPDSSRFPMVTHPLREGDQLSLLGDALTAEVLTLPGHTLDHIGYITNAGVFCGDTLFSAGCGRLFEGSAAQLFESLGKLKRLADDTRVYCAHEYTAANLRFALQVDPDNADLLAYQRQVAKLTQQGIPTLPSHIGLERAVNPFLRTDQEQIQAAVECHSGQSCPDEVAVLAGLRSWKDTF